MEVVCGPCGFSFEALPSWCLGLCWPVPLMAFRIEAISVLTGPKPQSFDHPCHPAEVAIALAKMKTAGGCLKDGKAQ